MNRDTCLVAPFALCNGLESTGKPTPRASDPSNTCLHGFSLRPQPDPSSPAGLDYDPDAEEAAEEAAEADEAEQQERGFWLVSLEDAAVKAVGHLRWVALLCEVVGTARAPVLGAL